MALMTPNEGEITKKIEKQTAKLPSAVFLGAALTAMGASLVLKCMGKKNTALFIGQWASPLLIMGLYDKIVKTNGHD